MIETTPAPNKNGERATAKTPAQKIANLAKFKTVIREVKRVIGESKSTPGRQTSVMLFDGESTVVLMVLDTPSFLANGLMTVEGLAEFAEAGAEAVASAYRLSPRRAPSVSAADLDPSADVVALSPPLLDAQGECSIGVVDAVVATDEKPAESLEAPAPVEVEALEPESAEPELKEPVQTKKSDKLIDILDDNENPNDVTLKAAAPRRKTKAKTKAKAKTKNKKA